MSIVHARRWAGFGFFTLHADNVLPAVFAFAAGLGDMTITLTAPGEAELASRADAPLELENLRQCQSSISGVNLAKQLPRLMRLVEIEQIP